MTPRTQTSTSVARYADRFHRALVAEAVQVARAAFGAEGFEAAAMTVLGMVRGMPQPDREVKVRVVDVRSPAPAWAALPVFTAWVAEPTDA